MVKLFFLALMLLLCLIPVDGEARPMGKRARLRQMEGEVIVRFKKNTSAAERVGVMARKGHVPARRMRARELNRVLLARQREPSRSSSVTP